MRMTRLDRYLWQAIGGRRSRRRIQTIEITQGGLGARGWMCVVLVSASAHDPWLCRLSMQL